MMEQVNTDTSKQQDIRRDNQARIEALIACRTGPQEAVALGVVQQAQQPACNACMPCMHASIVPFHGIWMLTTYLSYAGMLMGLAVRAQA